jgi:threonine/homoserine/homoserine lactone efflux protein
MNHADGLFLVALGALMITRDQSGAKLSFIVGTVIVALVTASVLLYYIATKCKKQ